MASTNLGPDGEKVVDLEYYNLLGVATNATDVEIKKAYRKQALIWHPDRNPNNPEAQIKFQEIGEAFSILSDSNSRAVYNKQGKKSALEGEQEMPDPAMIFSQIFGGDAFVDWIGEISLGKDVSKAFEMSTTEEEREALKTELNPTATTTPTPAPQSSISHAPFEIPPHTTTTAPSFETGKEKAPPTTSTTLPTGLPGGTFSTPGKSPAELSLTEKRAALEEKRLLAEKAALEKKLEREKMEAYEAQRTAEKKERIEMLVRKLRERVRPFVESSSEEERGRLVARLGEEGRDLGMQSFGVEICWLIGEVYMTKANQYIKLHKKASSNILGIPAWGSRVKEKFTMLKEGWSFLSVGLDVQSAMLDMEKRQNKGEIDEEEMKKLEQDLSGKLLLVAWKGSRFELSAILRQVVDVVLSKETPSVTDAMLMERAKAILLIGAIMKAVKPEESDGERRELERLVAEANAKRKEKGGKKPTTTATASGSGSGTTAKVEV